ncbi:MAG: PRC-barrel domain-containing protein [Methanobrevibacter sp.]|uniref:Photosystem reaction center subunit H n=1 Tax=Methanobrevibacter millerae TaxID=230361 RepID=A0A8T3VRN2_9EURY|nr:PRC-barrel domain-containing protein [Methanobrevibacter sp.]MBE6510716.1 photosystem reaction center subunit H [Methanobrevibacter millerae]MBO5150597.1 PRC-barrel domain-containing protein [Methanobrevibacter sp.]
MRTKELFNKEILDADACIIGKVSELVFDEDTFEITDLVIKKTGFSEQIRDSENVIPVELVKAIGDKVLLKSDDDI